MTQPIVQRPLQKIDRDGDPRLEPATLVVAWQQRAGLEIVDKSLLVAR